MGADLTRWDRQGQEVTSPSEDEPAADDWRQRAVQATTDRRVVALEYLRPGEGDATRYPVEPHQVVDYQGASLPGRLGPRSGGGPLKWFRARGPL